MGVVGQELCGTTLAGYTIGKVIGRGGNATVFEAVSVSGERVALKIMHAPDPSGVARQRFAREAALMQRLDHPNIARVFDFGHTAQEDPYLVMELLEGQTLKRLVRKEAPLAHDRVQAIALQILDGVAAAHAQRIVHRDLKPTNVFMLQAPGQDTAKVLDFGLAKGLESNPKIDGRRAALTLLGHRLGTPRYMSPEMARGETSAEQGDLYAVGLLIAEMLSGLPVVTAQEQLEMLMAHASPDELQLHPAVLNSPFSQIIRRVLAKDLRVRHRTAMQLRAELESITHQGSKQESEEVNLMATMVFDERQVAQATAPSPATARLPEQSADLQLSNGPGHTLPIGGQRDSAWPARAAAPHPQQETLMSSGSDEVHEARSHVSHIAVESARTLSDVSLAHEAGLSTRSPKTKKPFPYLLAIFALSIAAIVVMLLSYWLSS